MKKYLFNRFTKFAVILAVAVFGIGVSTAHADSFSTFAVSGTFVGGGTFTGNVTVDNTTASISGASLSTLGTLPFSFNCASNCSGVIVNQGPNDGTNGYAASFVSGSTTLSLVFFTADGTLMNYTGGGFCVTGSAACGDPSMLFTNDGETMVAVASGSSAVPEPATYLMLGSGLLCLALLGRKRLATNS